MGMQLYVENTTVYFFVFEREPHSVINPIVSFWMKADSFKKGAKTIIIEYF